MISPKKSSFEGGAERREAEDVGLARMHVNGLWQHPSPRRTAGVLPSRGDCRDHAPHNDGSADASVSHPYCSSFTVQTSSTATEVITRSFGISAGQ